MAGYENMPIELLERYAKYGCAQARVEYFNRTGKKIHQTVLRWQDTGGEVADFDEFRKAAASRMESKKPPVKPAKKKSKLEEMSDVGDLSSAIANAIEKE